MLLPLAAPVVPAKAQTIENVAQARWTFDGRTFTGQSNRVQLDVQQRAPSIQTYVPGSGSSLPLRPSACGASYISSQRSGGDPVAVAVDQTSVVTAGRTLLFSVDLASANIDPGAIDSITVVLSAASGDRETVTIYETAVDSGRFTGSIATRRLPPAAVLGDCRLSLQGGDDIHISALARDGSSTAISSSVAVLENPFGIVFDSETGAPVDGAVVTLVDAITGRPAIVFAQDGITPWPSSIVAGQPIVDNAGNTVITGPGEFWFPVTAPGNYRLVVTPPAPFSAPSIVPAPILAQLAGPGGRDFAIGDGSYGNAFDAPGGILPLTDIPLDRPGNGVTIVKTASRAQALPGDAVFYTLTIHNPDIGRARTGVTVTDTPSPWLRLRRDSIRIDGSAPSGGVTIAQDGGTIAFDLGTIAAGGERRITYAMTIAPDAPDGHVENEVSTSDSFGRRAETSASVEILRDIIAGRMTIIGRVTAGDCSLTDDAQRIGIPGVRVMMEDGSFAVTDIEGRYHFDGVVPGTHVVQASRMTLPEGGEFVDCTRSSRSQGSAISRLVTGQGGSLVVVDYHATVPQDRLSAIVAAAQPLAVLEENGLDTAGLADQIEGETAADTVPQEASATAEWLAMGDGEIDWLAPAVDENPRAPSIRVAIRHRRGQTVELLVDGQPANALAFEGVLQPREGRWEVSHWRGIPLSGTKTALSARVVSAAGDTVAELSREVYFTNIPARAELVEERSTLVADGRTAPVVAVRVLDAAGRPMREGVSGQFNVSAPYESARQVAQQQLDQLTRRGPSSARWTVAGDDGVALIELAPTMVSGSLQLDFRFDDGEIAREQQLDAWIVPGDIEWTIIGLAEGTIGARSVADNMERTGDFDSDLGDDARVALYAKGRVLGRYLVTVAYDSAAQEDDARLLGTLDPDAYYTVFADGSSRQFDAASREKLYVRIETASFYALYGDFETGFTDTRLTRYQRVATGVLAEARLGDASVRAFGAEIGTRFRRDEIQGQGISGPYTLSSRAIVTNSETVTLETRDRFRSEIIVDSRTLVRFADYTIDPLSGTITFREPVLSRDFDLNPQFIVIDYETDTLGEGRFSGGVRAEWESRDGAVRIGGTAVTDMGDGARTVMGGVDLRARIRTATEIRAEIAASERDGSTATGWLVEAQHQTGSLDVLAYARSTDADFGVGQQNGVELGRRKVGVDARVRLSEDFAVLASAWQDDSLDTAARRRAAQVELGYTTEATDLRLGLAHFDDRLADGTSNTSTVVEGGVTQRAFGNKLELSASTSIALDQAESIDLPTRHRLGARFAITDDLRAVALYEYADSADFTSSTLRGGFELTPWAGGAVNAAIGQQDIAERGTRSFAAFGLSQKLQVTGNLSIDATLDSNWTLGGQPDVGDLVNSGHPAASGGQFGPAGGLFEEFTAVTLGGAWRADRWAATARGEYRNGQYADRLGFSAGLIRQLGEGRVLGSGITWTQAKADNGAETEIVDAALAMAHRPAGSDFALLSKLEYRSDAVRDAVAGDTGGAGRTALLVDGDARSSRMIASISANWSPRDYENEEFDEEGPTSSLLRQSELGVFVGYRHNFDRFEAFDLGSDTVLVGLDARVGLGERIELGANATVRADLDGASRYAIGPSVGFVPVDGVLLTVGYNLTGFDDPDFSDTRNTNDGIYAAVRMKIDADTFGFLGLGR
ncbi:DUF11 domain-containing protein [Aurantiacibacter luteus]|uniref:DUF11 domain-containing protein n=1 Tax=Aurantiacibacter luteus TaxID=1581420 RepID=UPI0006994A6B|nr:DUF11 domain-containing protein [Aurantiacibacter luteus]